MGKFGFCREQLLQWVEELQCFGKLELLQIIPLIHHIQKAHILPMFYLEYFKLIPFHFVKLFSLSYHSNIDSVSLKSIAWCLASYLLWKLNDGNFFWELKWRASSKVRQINGGVNSNSGSDFSIQSIVHAELARLLKINSNLEVLLSMKYYVRYFRFCNKFIFTDTLTQNVAYLDCVN